MSKAVSSPAAHGHATLGPSSSARWLQCPGSVRRSVGVPNESTPAAERGTRCHALAEAALLVEFVYPADEFVDRWAAAIADWKQEYPDADDMLELCGVAEQYVSVVREVRAELGEDARVLVEERVQVPGTQDEVWGTADAIVVSRSAKALHICDLKAGKGVRVVARDNTQLRLYALGALNLVDPNNEWCEDVYMSIVQPARDGWTRDYMRVPDLLRWNGWVGARVEAVFEENAPVRPSEKACQWCPVRDECPEFLEWRAESWFGSGGVQPAPPKESVTATELGRHLALAEEAREYVKAVDRAAHAFDPAALPDGWRPVVRRRTKVAKPAVLSERLKRIGVDPLETRLKSLTQLRKETGPAFDLVAGDAIAVTETTTIQRCDAE